MRRTLKSPSYRLAANVIDRNDIRALIRWLRTDPHLTKGPLTEQFEQAWAKWVGARYAIFCNSGSSANLLMAYTALLSGALPNRKVIVPSVGWVTTVSPFMQLGFQPIMCGADRDNFGLDLAELEGLLKRHRPAIVAMVQVLGVPGRMEALMRLKRRYKFILLEDACAALGAEYGGHRVGTFGDMGSFSFFYGHQLSTIEGGMVVTGEKHFYDMLLMLRSHGWGKDLDPATRKRLLGRWRVDSFHEPFTFFVPGLNLRSTDLNAFLGLRQVRKADRITRIRHRNHLLYAKRLRGVDFQRWNERAKPCSISFGALAADPEHRRAIVTRLDKNRIETRLFSAGNLGRHPFWAERYGVFKNAVADRIHACGFFLPNHESLTPEDVKFISNVVNQA